MAFELPKSCPKCGIEGSLVEDKDHIHCTDCGSSMPKSELDEILDEAFEAGKDV